MGTGHQNGDGTLTRPPIAEIQRGSRERLRIELTERGGKWYVDCRVWFVGADGNFKPSCKGVCIRPDHLAPLIQGLGLAARALEGGVR